MGRRPAERQEELLKIVTVDIPAPYRFLWEPAPTKVVHGGRAATKDWSFSRVLIHLMCLYDEAISDINADALARDWCKQIGISNPGLIIRSIRFPHRVLCVREIQESIEASVHALLKDQITRLGFSSRFVITEKSISRTKGAGEFIYAGLRNDRSMHVKSTEGVTIGWAVEAQGISESSWNYYIPTIRTEGAEVWISFNDDYADSPTHQRFVVHPPDGAIEKQINSFGVEWVKLPVPASKNCAAEKFVNCPGCPGDPALKDPNTGLCPKNCGGVRTKYISMTTLQTRKSDYSRDPIKSRNIWGGELLGVGLKIYPMFDERVHVKEFDWKYVKNHANLYMGCDPALNHYPACVWGAKFKDVQTGDFILWIYDEYPDFETFGEPFCNVRRSVPLSLSLEQLAAIFFEKDGLDNVDKGKGLNIRSRFIDTRLTEGVGKANSFSPSSEGMVGEFRKVNMNFLEPDRTKIDIQRDAIIKSLQYNKNDKISAINHPTLYISSRCKNLTNAFRNHRMEEKGNRETEKYKDFIDALRIMLAGMSGHEWIDPTRQQQTLTPPEPPRGGDWMGH